jgi:uncharacterized protein
LYQASTEAILTDMEFEWDFRKAEANLAKHGISFSEAATVFGDPLAITYFDPDHSITEDRYLTFGATTSGRYVAVVHTDRDGKVRLVSARPMTSRERIHYGRQRY